MIVETLKSTAQILFFIKIEAIKTNKLRLTIIEIW